MQTWQIRKGQLESDKGIISAQHFEAARAGARVLQDGGNAMDAGVTAALVLSVVEPWLSGVGGGGFHLHAQAGTGTVEALDFNMCASRNVDPRDYRIAAGRAGDWFDWPAVEDDLNLIGYRSICVPGAVAGFAEALARHGTISWTDAVAPAAALAERGMEIDWYAALCLAIDAQGLGRFPASAKLFLDDGKPFRTVATGGERYRPMKAKAATLRALAERGARDFYEGGLAATIISDLQAGGSPIDAADFAGYKPRWEEPAKAAYRDVEINAIASYSGGPSFLDAMREIEQHLRPHTKPDAGAARIYVRAIRHAYEHRLKHMGHAARKDGDCTSHLSVVDRNGNMVSMTNTLLSRFGSKVTLPSTGILMNNGMMWFDPRPGMPNSIAPGAEPLANMCPLLFKRSGQPFLAIGAAGGRQIFPALVQLASFVIDYGMSLEEAFHTPRIDASTPTIFVDRMAPADIAAAVGKEFSVKIISNTLHPVNFAIPSAVMRDRRTRRHVGMAHPVNPWTYVAEEGLHDDEV